jgi:hypothetical protein
MRDHMTSPGGGERHHGQPIHGLPHGWAEWYRFADEELGYEHDERVEYANLRYVEEQNRNTLRRSDSHS